MKKHGVLPLEAELMRELLGAIVQFMARSGLSKSATTRIFSESIAGIFDKDGRHRGSRKSTVSYGCDTIAGAVLREWHRSPKYLDASAKPIPLPAKGATRSLSALVRVVSKTDDPAAVIESMRSAKLIRAQGHGMFVPARQAATISALNPLSVDHVAKTVIRLVETASRNMSGDRRKPPLIERYAHVPDLSASESEAFSDFSRQQGQAFLDAIEDWLEARQIRYREPNSAQVPVNAGVHIFAFLGEPLVPASRPSARRQTKQPTSSREARA